STSFHLRMIAEASRPVLRKADATNAPARPAIGCQRKRPSYMPVSRAGGPGPLSGVQDQESFPGRRRSCDFPNQLVRSTAIFVAVKVPEDTSNRPEAVTAITAVWPPSKSLESCVTKSENVLKLSFRMPVA